jgi:hypothetical protein
VGANHTCGLGGDVATFAELLKTTWSGGLMRSRRIGRDAVDARLDALEWALRSMLEKLRDGDKE